MGKITERNFDRSTAGTWGSVTISPTDDVVVGSFSTWTITFTVGAYAMDVGGGLKIGTRRQSDFGSRPVRFIPATPSPTSLAIHQADSGGLRCNRFQKRRVILLYFWIR